MTAVIGKCSIILAIVFFLSCSNAKEQHAYSQLQETLNVSEQIMATSYDYEIKDMSCSNAINSIQAFNIQFPKSEHNSTLSTTLLSWQQRRDAGQAELKSLIEKLSEVAQNKAIKVANAQHMMSNIEKMELTSQEKHKEGNKYVVDVTYDVRMRGIILGTSIYKFKVYIKGYIAMDTKTVGLYDDARVEE
jgi:hypothetical protein